MSRPAPSRSHLAASLVLLICGLGAPLDACLATGDVPLAAILVEADTGKVLYARNANRRLRPASLTKLMTALLVMQDMDADPQLVDQQWPVSARAAAQPASRLGLQSGRSMRASAVLDAVLVASANDAAMVAAEAIAGSELDFVRRMNAVAASLGMTRTRFANPSGLPAPQFTTARDMAVLARHLWHRFPAQRLRFAQTGIDFGGRWVGSTNALLGNYRGARGMKTGFTCRAGFNLVAAATRKGRTLLAVVLGARGRDVRSRAVRKLFDDGFSGRLTTVAPDLQRLAEAPGQGDALPMSNAIIARSCTFAKGPSGWSIDIGVRRTDKEARALARKFIAARRSKLRGARAWAIPRFTGVDLHRAIVTGLDQESARTACLEFRTSGGMCIIFDATVASAQLEEVARIRTLQSAWRARKPDTDKAAN